MTQFGGFSGAHPSIYRIRRLAVISEGTGSQAGSFGRVSNGAVADVDDLLLGGITLQAYPFEFDNEDPWRRPLGGSVRGVDAEGKTVLDAAGNLSADPAAWRSQFSDLYGEAAVRAAATAPAVVTGAVANTNGKVRLTVPGHGIPSGSQNRYFAGVRFEKILGSGSVITKVDGIVAVTYVDSSTVDTTITFTTGEQLSFQSLGYTIDFRRNLERWARERNRALLVEAAQQRGQALYLEDLRETVLPSGRGNNALWVTRGGGGAPIVRAVSLVDARSPLNSTRPRNDRLLDVQLRPLFPGLTGERAGESQIPWRDAPNRGPGWRIKDLESNLGSPPLIRVTTLPDHHRLQPQDWVVLGGVANGANANGIWRVASATSATIDLTGSNPAQLKSYTPGTGFVAKVEVTTVAITNAVAASVGGPVRLASAGHGFADGERVLVGQVGGVPAATGEWTVASRTSTTLDLAGSVFAGTFTLATNAGYALRPAGSVLYRPGLTRVQANSIAVWVDARLGGTPTTWLLGRSEAAIGLPGPLTTKPVQLVRGDATVASEQAAASANPANLTAGQWCWSSVLTVAVATGSAFGWNPGDTVTQ